MSVSKKQTTTTLVVVLLLLSIPLTTFCSKLPHLTLQLTPSTSHNSMRPAPSRDLPILDLMEPPGKMYDPKPEDLDIKALKEKMGKNYDPVFMSAKKPLEAAFRPNGTLELSYKRNKKGRLVPVGKMPKEIKKLRFKFLRLPSGHKLRSRVTPKLRRKLRQFLWTYTFCPVVYSWKDLGLRFWPRWIREGGCFNGGGHSCSFPEGMSCKPSQSIAKMVLRWHCQDWNQAKYCKWIPVRYPIITGCSCAC